MSRRASAFQTIHSEGGLLPPDLLRRVVDPAARLPGTRPEDYGLPPGERLNEVIVQSWNRLQRHWADFQSATATLAEGEAGTALTNDRWTLPLTRELGFGTLPTSVSPTIDDKTYAISRFSGAVPLHLIGRGLSLDRRKAGQKGAASSNPHGLVQEYLNRAPDAVWGIVSNGLELRILRDSQALSRQSYLAFDLQAMMAGAVYSDFVLLWMTAHATRFVPRDPNRPGSCWLEEWTQVAVEDGTRAFTDLRAGVEKALQILGEGFTSHPANTALRDALRTNQLTPRDLHYQLLRVVYRLLFLFVAEDRTLDHLPVLHPPGDTDADRAARDRYTRYYSTGRLRDLADRIKGSRHGDLWRQFQLIVGALSGDPKFSPLRESLALPVLGSLLWDPARTASLNGQGLAEKSGTELSNYDFLEALRHLAYIQQDGARRAVDFKNLGSDEFGGIYESLLSLTPQVIGDSYRFTFAEFAGNERKTSGSYYTPDSLVQCLLDSALEPVVDERLAGKTGAEAEKALLSLKVCDPAVGSGHFLVGAAHRLARRLARIRANMAGESEPSPTLYQHALRDVIGRCLYGVDINEMSAELCRVTLWLEAIEPGKPLSFLDHHIRCGNSLLGTTPDLMEKGIPDEAFLPIEGDDSKYCSAFKKVNRQEARDTINLVQGTLFTRDDAPAPTLSAVASALAEISELPDDTPEQIQGKERRYAAVTSSDDFTSAHLLADTWCAAFFWKKCKPQEGGFDYPITNQVYWDCKRHCSSVANWMRDEILRIASQYQFFHWHYRFPEVFGSDGNGGFDIVLGNPPWERVKLQEREWFFSHGRDKIANAPNAAARNRLIEILRSEEPTVYNAFLDDVRKAEGESHYLRNSGHTPLCGRGDINLYAVFAECMRGIISPCGRMGAILPSGIAADDTTKFFFQAVVKGESLRSLFDFENRKGLFPDVDSRMRFCLFTSGSAQGYAGGCRPSPAQFAFFCLGVEDLQSPDKLFELSPEDIALLNPNTLTCPTFRSKNDARLALATHARLPVFVAENLPGGNIWNATFYKKVFDMALSARQFLSNVTLVEEPVCALYEAKLIHQFDHRFASYRKSGDDCDDVATGQKRDAAFNICPRYYVRVDEVLAKGTSRRKWFLIFRSITNSTNERTLISAVIPFCAISDSIGTIVADDMQPSLVACLLSNLNSFAIDYHARLRVAGMNLSQFYLKQFPVVPPSVFEKLCHWAKVSGTNIDWFLPRVLELTYTAWDLEAFAQDCGFTGPPFRWDEDRRFLLRCELDAAFFHLYLGPEEEWRKQPPALTQAFPTPRDAVSYIMDTFPIVKRKDEAAHNGAYRTKDTILRIYDALQTSILTSTPYQTLLSPPPADPSCCHPPRD